MFSLDIDNARKVGVELKKTYDRDRVFRRLFSLARFNSRPCRTPFRLSGESVTAE